MTRRLVIMGAAGRDFHIFNCCYRDDPDVEVVAFTAAQIPHIENRLYPPSLAGPRYPKGIAIHPEDELGQLLRDGSIDEVVFGYSDVSNAYVDARRKFVESWGAAFSLFDVDATMLAAVRPVIAVCAARTGCGKSQTSRRVAQILMGQGRKIAVLRHPMPYGNLEKQVVQRFATLNDLDEHDCTVEEREEFEPHVRNGVIVYAGVDYAAVLAAAEQEAEVIVWDGGNNDTPFLRPELWITVTDPHRAGHEVDYFPGHINFRRADIIVINKVDSARADGVAAIEANAARLNPGAQVILARSPLRIPDAAAIHGKRVLVIEDGPTMTHGGMAFGAGVVAARRSGAAVLVDPRPFAVGEIAATYANYPQTGPLLPALGYGKQQLKDLEATVNATDCDLVIIATPVDLTRLVKIDKPLQRISYSLAEIGDALAKAVSAVH